MKLFYTLILCFIAFSSQAQHSDTLSLRNFHYPPPPPPPPPPVKNEKSFKYASSLPRFYSKECESLSVKKREKRKCSNKKLLEYVYENLKYPTVSKSDSLEGMVVIQFTVKRNGFLADIKVVRSLGKEYDAEAKRIVESMNELPNRFIPAYAGNRIIDVTFNLPVKFYPKN